MADSTWTRYRLQKELFSIEQRLIRLVDEPSHPGTRVIC